MHMFFQSLQNVTKVHLNALATDRKEGCPSVRHCGRCVIIYLTVLMVKMNHRNSASGHLVLEKECSLVIGSLRCVWKRSMCATQSGTARVVTMKTNVVSKPIFLPLSAAPRDISRIMPSHPRDIFM